MRQSRLFTTIITLTLLWAMVIGCAGPKTVTFPDVSLEAAIREALNVSLGEELTIEELASLTTLSICGSEGITNLSCLDYCTNLTELSISNNQISDVSPLSPLTNLTSLYLSNNQISDITPLSSLTNLNLLAVGGNQIIDICPLSSLTNLTVLDSIETR